MDRRELVELKIAMEFGVAPVGDTLPLAATNDEGQPRLLVSHFTDTYATFCRSDVPLNVRSELSALDPATLFEDEARVRDILRRDRAVAKVYRIRWYTIERIPDRAEFPDVTILDGRHVIVVDGQVVAWAATDQEDDRSAEVSIETLEGYRRRGYARQVTASWAASVLGRGKVAFYSHLLANAPSHAVATSLGLAHLSDEVEYV